MISPDLRGAVSQAQVEALPVWLHENQSVLAKNAAQIAANHLKHALADKELARVILATGQSQLLLLDHLLEQPGIDWKRIVFFHMDEYLGLPSHHPSSFRQYLYQKVDRRIKSRQFHYLAGDALEPIRECERYAALLQSAPIDLGFLGIGNNGHLAFNDPPVAHFEDPYPVKIVKLDPICRQQQVDQGHFPNIHAMPQYALTISIPQLCASQKLLCLASGKHKAAIVRRMLTGQVEPGCPASILRQHSHALLLLDPEAASLLDLAFTKNSL